MRLFKFFIFILFALSINLSSVKSEDLKTQITKNLRCIICQGQSVYDSDSEFSNSIKILVEGKLDDGLSEKQIYKYLKDRYGEWILYDPVFDKNTYFLWILPILMFAVGGAIILRMFFLKKK